MIRVLQIIPAIATESGVANYIWNVAQCIDDAEVVFDYLYHIGAPVTYEKSMRERGAQVIQMPNIASDPWGYARGIKALFARSVGMYDIVHCHCPNTAFVNLRLARHAGIKVRVLHAHQAESSEIAFKRMRNCPLIHFGRRFATHRLACSDGAGRSVFGGHSFLTMPNGVDAQRFAFDKEKRATFRRKYSISPTAPVVACVGRLSPTKNQEHLIRMMPCVLEDVTDAILLIAGGGEMESYLRSIASDCGVMENVVFTGGLDDASPVYSAADVLAMPSIKEGFPMVSLEAQAAGLPCVFSNGVPSEADVTGNVVFAQLESISEWKEALIGALASERKRGAAEAIASSPYSVASSAHRLVSLYRGALEEAAF